MLQQQVISGRILTPEGWLNGAIHINPAGRIEAIRETAGGAQSGPLIIPGFIDLHVHGGAGYDVMQADAGLEKICAMHARHGTTALLATTVTAPLEQISRVLTHIAVQASQRCAGTARILGVHLEGPFIHPRRLGAQPNYPCLALQQQLDQLCELAPVKVITLAPELPGHAEAITYLRQRGIRVQIGHSDGSYEDGVNALRLGASSFTHLFNAMTPLHHRSPGMCGAALAHADYAEIIPDLLHVHPGAIRAALRAIPYLYCVTDSTAAAGMPDGQYLLGSHSVTKCMGGVRLADGTLAGSALTMDQALRNLVGLGLSLAEASQRLSRNPARYLGLNERGQLIPGSWADLVLLNADLNVNRVYIEGEEIVINDA